jgi:rod shape-determining protein MreC
MRNLILLFLKYGSFFLFVALELLSFYLIIQYNEGQREIYVSSVNNFTGYLDSRAESTRRYFQLTAINDSLALENATLRGRLDNIYASLSEPGIDSLLRDSALEAQYNFLPAKVVNNSITKTNNYLTIDKGSKDGIRPHMGVITGNGVAGIVRSVSTHYALVMSLLHRNIRIPASIQRTGYFGPIVWNGRNPTVVYMDDIPKHAVLSAGDTVTTSGYSRLFPPGLPIGVIDTFWIEDGSNFYQTRINLLTDLSRITYVYVVNHATQTEADSLEEEGQNE